MKLNYIYAKAFKKFLRGKAVINSEIDKTAKINSGVSITNSKIGRYSNIGYDDEINNAEIGNFCSFSDHVFIGGDEHPLEWVSTSPVFESVKHSGPKRKFAEFDIPEGKRTIIVPENTVSVKISGCSLDTGKKSIDRPFSVKYRAVRVFDIERSCKILIENHVHELHTGRGKAGHSVINRPLYR